MMIAAQPFDLDAYRRSMGAGPRDWVPNPGPQTKVLSCPTFEVLYGGAKGGGKSQSGIVGALRLIHHPRYRALLLRRQYTQLTRTLIPECKRLYKAAGGIWVAGIRSFVFPSGALIELGAVDTEGAVEKFQGAEYQYVYFDELTHYTQTQYLTIISCMRSSDGLPLRVRSGSNPGDPDGRGEWVLDRWAPWLYRPGQSGYDGPYAADGETLYFRPAGGDAEGEVICDASDPDAQGRTFFAAKVTDTPQLLQDEQYMRNLHQLDLVQRKRFLEGDWHARDAAGEFFQRPWFANAFHQVAPARVLARVRYWDLASTPENRATPRSAFTAGVLMSKTDDGLYWVEDIVRGQWGPLDVEKTIKATAELDERNHPGTMLFIERDPGQAGASQANYFARALEGHDVHTIQPQGDKIARARPVSAQAEAGNLHIVLGAWVDPFLKEAERFPEGLKDQIDGLSGAFKRLLPYQARVARRRPDRPGAGGSGSGGSGSSSGRLGGGGLGGFG